jgi:hypothetical protein
MVHSCSNTPSQCLFVFVWRLNLDVFDYEPAFVTLFYERGSTSRFVRQKILINIAPIDEYRLANRIDDVSKDFFAYTYMYGLLIHKLGHFFDVVHGSRHDFFMTEYRATFMLPWLRLLERKGFDPAAVATAESSQHHLWEVVL